MQFKIPIIYYHSIAPHKHPKWFKRYLTLELKYFEEHLKFFKKEGYNFINLDEFFELKKGKQNKKHVCLTFDDGYADNFIYGYPLLKKYKAKATIFVNPYFTDKRPILRKTLDDYWNNKVSLNGINDWGFLSWDEMLLMEKSGFVDIQSHTLTHAKHFVTDKIIGFHYPGRDCLYPIGNLFPERLPYYIDDPNFEKLIPFGYPFFEQKSSISSRKVEINNSFNQSIIQSFKGFDWSQQYDFQKMFNHIVLIYEEFKKNNSMILRKESDEQYKLRVNFELSESKRIIERELNKNISYCCWPHGDSNEFAHDTALALGYKATTQGNAMDREEVELNDSTIPRRIGLSKSKNSVLLTQLKTKFKIKSFQNKFPYYQAYKFYNLIKYGTQSS